MESFVIMTGYKSKRRHYRISDVDVLIIDAKELFLNFFFLLLLRFVIVIFPIQLYANESVAEHVGFARVFIDLLNENDNRPVFSQPLYNISLLESTGTGTSLLRIQVSRAHTHTHTYTISVRHVNKPYGGDPVLLQFSCFIGCDLLSDCTPSIHSLPNPIKHYDQ